ncbi:WD repeat-containing protein 49-like isoform X2 [Huso huso]|uniref:WD repeat-containing protein 49-like isoform X2 n=1 Tax=Huso huso TaxID=61971 RepID=A0ABR1AAT3_HUSHU
MSNAFPKPKEIVGYPDKEESSSFSARRVLVHLPAQVTEIPHREAILKVASMPDNSLLAVGQDGLVSLWSPELKLKKTRSVLEENKQPSRTPKWIADTTLMPQYNKLVIGTCDRELRLYDLSNFGLYFQITGLESMPLQLDYSYKDKDECILLYGDDQGCVNIIIITRVGETLRNWSKSQPVEGIPSVSIEAITEGGAVSYTRWKVHNDWVTKIKYCHSIQSVISSSNDEDTSLVIGTVTGTKNVLQRLKEMSDAGSVKDRPPLQTGSSAPHRLSSDESVFKAYKGVKTFDFSRESNLLVTGGLDRAIRLWNPYIPGWPIGLLQGHNAPVSFLHISTEESRIYSVSTDNNVMVWDMEDQICLASIISRASQIRGELSACYFSEELGAICIATDTLALLQFRHNKTELSNASTSHKRPVLCCRYIKQFQHVISCCEGSVFKVWDLITGAPVFEFSGVQAKGAVTCMTLDISGKRLITGGRDGSVRKWDYSSGQCVSVLRHASDIADEVNSCIQVEIHSNRYIISVGCDRRISIFPDHQDGANGIEDLGSQWLHQEPSPHREEIVSVSLWPPSLLATSSCAGELLVWNLISGNVFTRLGSADTAPLREGTDDLNICSVLFIPSRGPNQKTAASLVASGPGGCIHFWNIFGGGKLFGQFSGSPQKATVVALTLSGDDTLLFAGDRLGFVYIWNIQDYAQNAPETTFPPLLHSWRAHTYNITRYIYPQWQLLLTSSRDCQLRLWSCQGELIGMFGENEHWDVNEKESWSRELTEELRTASGDLPVQEPARSRPESPTTSNPADRDSGNQLNTCQESTSSTNELAIEEELELYQYNPRVQRVHLKQVEIPQVCGRLMTFQSLHYHELADIHNAIHKPCPAAELNDPYDFSF